MQQMTSRRPYLIRAYYEWILDNGLTPYISVDAEHEEVQVPREYVEEGQIVLNLNPSSIRNLELGQEYILFDARFSGRAQQLIVPIVAVLAIYAQENGEGMAFAFKHLPEDEDSKENSVQDEESQDDLPPTRPPAGRRPSLKVVK